MKEKTNADADQARDNLRSALENRPQRVTLKSLSLALGRNAAYLHQYLYRGSPRSLPEDVRLNLARMLGINEQMLRPHDQGEPLNGHNIAIKYLDHPSQKDHADGPWFIPQGFMNGMGGPPAESLRLAMVGAHSSPAFHSTDVVMIDITDRNPLNAGYFALDMGDHLRIRHLEQVTPNGFCVKIAKANQSGYESMLEADILLGRIIFHAQMFPTFPQATP